MNDINSSLLQSLLYSWFGCFWAIANRWIIYGSMDLAPFHWLLRHFRQIRKDELGITDIPGDGTLPICSAVVDHSFTYLIRPLLALTHSLARVPPHSFSLVRSAANVLGWTELNARSVASSTGSFSLWLARLGNTQWAERPQSQ